MAAAFYLSFPERLLSDDLPDLVRRAGVEVLRVANWGAQGVSTILGKWGGLDCETSMLSLAYYDVLIVTFRQDEFRARWTNQTGKNIPSRAQTVADAFAATCQALDPIAGLFTSYAWVDPGAYLTELENRVIGGDIPSLAREHLWLLYVTSDDLELLTSHLPESASEIVRLPQGAILILELDRENWSS